MKSSVESPKCMWYSNDYLLLKKKFQIGNHSHIDKLGF